MVSSDDTLRTSNQQKGLCGSFTSEVARSSSECRTNGLPLSPSLRFLLSPRCIIHFLLVVAMPWLIATSVFNGLFCIPFATATIISSSQMQLCANDGSEAIPCQRKFVVALTLDGGQEETESVVYWASATGLDGKQLNLRDSYSITIKKSRPMTRYPLVYRASFNAKPYETHIRTGAFGCKDTWGAASPTCGYAYDPSGNAMAYSQGFCCKCSLCNVASICEYTKRPSLTCSIWSDAEAAICLKMDPLYYAAYAMQPPETWYNIVVTVKRTVEGSPSTVTEAVLRLGPDVLGQANAALGVSARLVGDFAKFKEAPTFDSKLLFIPSSPISHERVRAEIPREWLFVEKSMVTMDGSECDKVGVSYYAFNSQGERCGMDKGACLRNQIDDLRSADLTREAIGLAGQFMLRNYGTFVFMRDGDIATAIGRSFSSADAARAISSSSSSNVSSPASHRSLIGLKTGNSERPDVTRGSTDAQQAADRLRFLRFGDGKGFPGFGPDFDPALPFPPHDVLNRMGYAEAKKRAEAKASALATKPSAENEDPIWEIGASDAVAEASARREDTSAAAFSVQASSPYLAFQQSGVQATLVTLQFSADAMAFVVNVAPGVLLDYSVQTFEANSKNGKLAVTVMNVGNVTADFQITVTGCSAGTFPIAAALESIPARAHRVTTFDVYSSAVAGGVTNCALTLLDALNEVTDRANVTWRTTPQSTTGPQGGDGGNNGGPDKGENGGKGTISGTDASCYDCPWYNPVCFVTRDCFVGLVVQILSVVVIIALVLVAIRFRAPIIALLKFLFGCVVSAIKGGDSGDKGKDKKKTKKKKKKRGSNGSGDENEGSGSSDSDGVRDGRESKEKKGITAAGALNAFAAFLRVGPYAPKEKAALPAASVPTKPAIEDAPSQRRQQRRRSTAIATNGAHHRRSSASAGIGKSSCQQRPIESIDGNDEDEEEEEDPTHNNTSSESESDDYFSDDDPHNGPVPYRNLALHRTLTAYRLPWEGLPPLTPALTSDPRRHRRDGKHPSSMQQPRGSRRLSQSVAVSAAAMASNIRHHLEYPSPPPSPRLMNHQHRRRSPQRDGSRSRCAASPSAFDRDNSGDGCSYDALPLPRRAYPPYEALYRNDPPHVAAFLSAQRGPAAKARAIIAAAAEAGYPYAADPASAPHCPPYAYTSASPPSPSGAPRRHQQEPKRRDNKQKHLLGDHAMDAEARARGVTALLDSIRLDIGAEAAEMVSAGRSISPSRPQHASVPKKQTIAGGGAAAKKSPYPPHSSSTPHAGPVQYFAPSFAPCGGEMYPPIVPYNADGRQRARAYSNAPFADDDIHDDNECGAPFGNDEEEQHRRPQNERRAPQQQQRLLPYQYPLLLTEAPELPPKTRRRQRIAREDEAAKSALTPRSSALVVYDGGDAVEAAVAKPSNSKRRQLLLLSEDANTNLKYSTALDAMQRRLSFVALPTSADSAARSSGSPSPRQRHNAPPPSNQLHRHPTPAPKVLLDPANSLVKWWGGAGNTITHTSVGEISESEDEEDAEDYFSGNRGEARNARGRKSAGNKKRRGGGSVRANAILMLEMGPDGGALNTITGGATTMDYTDHFGAECEGGDGLLEGDDAAVAAAFAAGDRGLAVRRRRGLKPSASAAADAQMAASWHEDVGVAAPIDMHVGSRKNKSGTARTEKQCESAPSPIATAPPTAATSAATTSSGGKRRASVSANAPNYRTTAEMPKGRRGSQSSQRRRISAADPKEGADFATPVRRGESSLRAGDRGDRQHSRVRGAEARAGEGKGHSSRGVAEDEDDGVFSLDIAPSSLEASPSGSIGVAGKRSGPSPRSRGPTPTQRPLAMDDSSLRRRASVASENAPAALPPRPLPKAHRSPPRVPAATSHSFGYDSGDHFEYAFDSDTYAGGPAESTGSAEARVTISHRRPVAAHGDGEWEGNVRSEGSHRQQQRSPHHHGRFLVGGGLYVEEDLVATPRQTQTRHDDDDDDDAEERRFMFGNRAYHREEEDNGPDARNPTTAPRAQKRNSDAPHGSAPIRSGDRNASKVSSAPSNRSSPAGKMNSFRRPSAETSFPPPSPIPPFPFSSVVAASAERQPQSPHSHRRRRPSAVPLAEAAANVAGDAAHLNASPRPHRRPPNTNAPSNDTCTNSSPHQDSHQSRSRPQRAGPKEGNIACPAASSSTLSSCSPPYAPLPSHTKGKGARDARRRDQQQHVGDTTDEGDTAVYFDDPPRPVTPSSPSLPDDHHQHHPRRFEAKKGGPKRAPTTSRAPAAERLRSQRHRREDSVGFADGLDG